MTNHDPDHDRERDPDPANDNGGPGAIAPAPAGGALTALTGLATVLNAVDTASVAGRSGLPMLSFKARDNNGTWSIGQKKIVVEPDSRWAVNPTTFKWGYICFDNDNKPTERSFRCQPKPNVAELPDTGFEWQEEWAVNMKCTSGTDAGTEVTYKASTVGGIQAIAGMIDTIRDRLNSGMHDDKIVPIALLEKDSYPQRSTGRFGIRC